MSKIIRKKRVSKISLFLKNKDKIWKNQVYTKRQNNKNLNIEIENLQKEIEERKDNFQEENRKNKFLQDKIILIENDFKKEYDITNFLKKDIQEKEKEILELERKIYEEKVEYKKNILHESEVKKDIEINSEKRKLLTQEKKLLELEIENIQEKVDGLKETNNLLKEKSKKLSENKNQLQSLHELELERNISLQEILKNTTLEEGDLLGEISDKEKKIEKVISMGKKKEVELELIIQDNESIDSNIALKLSENQKYKKEIEILKNKIKKEYRLQDKLKISLESASKENSILKEFYSTLNNDESASAKNYHSLLDNMEEVVSTNEENLEKLIEIQRESDILFIKDSFKKIKDKANIFKKNFTKNKKQFIEKSNNTMKKINKKIMSM